VSRPGLFEEVPLEDFEKNITVNYLGNLLFHYH
jgi:hypothetical protein